MSIKKKFENRYQVVEAEVPQTATQAYESERLKGIIEQNFTGTDSGDGFHYFVDGDNRVTFNEARFAPTGISHNIPIPIAYAKRMVISGVKCTTLKNSPFTAEILHLGNLKNIKNLKTLDTKLIGKKLILMNMELKDLEGLEDFKFRTDAELVIQECMQMQSLRGIPHSSHFTLKVFTSSIADFTHLPPYLTGLSIGSPTADEIVIDFSKVKAIRGPVSFIQVKKIKGLMKLVMVEGFMGAVATECSKELTEAVKIINRYAGTEDRKGALISVVGDLQDAGLDEYVEF